jgi:hypothetical protein
MFRKSLFLSTWLVASIVADASAGPSSPTTTRPSDCAIPTSGELRVHLVNEAGAARDLLDAAQAETSAIWASVGVRLLWTSSHAPTDRPDVCGLVVIVRHKLSRPHQADDADSRLRAQPLLGRIAFGEDGRPGHLIEVSLAAVTARVANASHHGVQISDLPAFLQLPLLGRAIGRVMAHEIGHWSMGHGHTREGLMQASFGNRELFDATAPPLPPTIGHRPVVEDGAGVGDGGGVGSGISSFLNRGSSSSRIAR